MSESAETMPVSLELPTFLPAFTSPVLPIVCGLRDGEPVRIRGLVELDVLNQCMELLNSDSDEWDLIQ